MNYFMQKGTGMTEGQESHQTDGGGNDRGDEDIKKTVGGGNDRGNELVRNTDGGMKKNKNLGRCRDF
jgi:hypothetical protein